MRPIFSIYLILIPITFVNSENILFLVTVPSHSHDIWFSAIIKELAKQNEHNITLLTADAQENLPSNVHVIHLESIYDELSKNIPDDDTTEIGGQNQNPIAELGTSRSFWISSCSGAFKSNGLQTILNYPNNFTFDMIVYDYSCGPCFLFLMAKFHYPTLISASAFGNPPHTPMIVGGHNYPGYIPFYNLYYDVDMTFSQRVYNVIIHAACLIYLNFVVYPEQDRIARQNLKMDFPYLGDIEKRSILALVNTNPIIDFPQSLGPNVISVGGLQIKDPPGQLPEDIENFMNSSIKGAVLFSLGSFLRSDGLPKSTLTVILDAFAQMPQYHFLWKFESNTLPATLPKNVLVKPWLPQNDILAHNRTKAFITHGGLMSTLESTWYGVPIIGIPFVADQHRNIHKSTIAGVAVKINFRELSVDELKHKVLTVLEIPSYAKNMKIRSSRFRDQKEKPLDRAIWWINWALRNPYPEHMQSPVLKLGFIQSNCYDIICIGIATVLFIVYVMYQIIFGCQKNFRQKAKND